MEVLIVANFGKRSKEKLLTVDIVLRIILANVIEVYDFTILEGHRNETKQNKAFDEGRSKLRFPQSKHNQDPSLAVDIAPYPIDWNDTKRFYYLAGLVKATARKLGYRIRWGGDWDGDGSFKDQTFNDLPHFELIS